MQQCHALREGTDGSRKFDKIEKNLARLQAPRSAARWAKFRLPDAKAAANQFAWNLPLLPRNAPHNRALPDANVWLDAAFDAKGIARRALSLFVTKGIPLILEDSIEREVLRILNQRRLALALGFDPARHFLGYVSATSAIRVAPAPTTIEVSPVNAADRHVVRAAIHYQALLLTGDAPLVAQCQKTQVAAEFPWAAVVRVLGAPPVDEILRLAPLDAQRGTIFARTTPGGWSGMSNVGTFTVIDVERLGTLAFDSQTSEWSFSLSFGLDIRLAYPPAGNHTTIVCASYNFPGTGKRGQVVLRAARFGSDDRRAASVTTLKGAKGALGAMRIGSNGRGENFWNGNLRHLTTGSVGMPQTTWRAIAELQDAAPNPINRDVVDNALRALA